eukprot:CAMPEP_0201488404 /NCGR_PEP_ID=MMETSP0151_2-20130828/17986_1 /ASSEMBLY_ACC=CAM_ASM_000257 /TAXON_ID=200890 /ORGANISM="Paramoeba atlantica, Strain 621/1 / CCAP 1560/9" /LENGTH=59 /DNA_ID=CAMNT_0047873679 /DNA_START=218 /DNA_END=397 /DNA_ORIENTATION=-
MAHRCLVHRGFLWLPGLFMPIAPASQKTHLYNFLVMDSDTTFLMMLLFRMFKIWLTYAV